MVPVRVVVDTEGKREGYSERGFVTGDLRIRLVFGEGKTKWHRNE